MPKIPRSTKNIFITKTDRDGSQLYWQCGVWVNIPAHATRYISEDEAKNVILLRPVKGGVVTTLDK